MPSACRPAMAGRRRTTWNPKTVLPRTMQQAIVPILLQFLLTYAQGQGHGPQHEAAVPPVDERIALEIREGQPEGSLVGVIPIRRGLRYKFSEDPREFSLNAISGRITTTMELDRESLEQDTFDLFVQSTPSARHLIEVRITVLDINDNSPVFGQPSIEISYSESDQPGTQIILDTATDPDVGLNDVIANYKIVYGNEEGKFRLILLTDTSKPLLYLENTMALNREEKNSYLLQISAQDGGNPPNFGYLLVNISVTDVNDHQPLFDQSDYSVTVNETVPPGSSLINVRATDGDEGSNADITYSIVNDDHSQFGVESKTGIIRTKKKLHCDRSCGQDTSSNCNKPKTCVVTVEARDNGKPYPLTDRAYVTVSLIDENDHDPLIAFKFLPSTSTVATVDEGSDNNTVVALVSVTDQDDGLNGQTSFSIIKGNEKGHFRLEQTYAFYLVKVSGRLDREKTSKYNLTVKAVDMGLPQRSSTAYLIIMVNDINDHYPIFLEPTYSARLSELVPIGSYVASITATDNDTGINAQITYSIVSGDDLGWFHIDAESGLLTTKKPLDHEQRSTIILTIKAQDGGSLPYKSLTNVTITIWDENDEIPTFSSEQYYFTFPEDVQVGAEVTTVNAVDQDQGANGSVRYSVVERSSQDRCNNVFQLDSISGRITISSHLDRELCSQYWLKVKAQDQGSPPLSSTATVIINVTDINDNQPYFYPKKYFARVLENLPPHTFVVRVHAEDLDEGPNGEVQYSIQDGAERKFVIEMSTGSISTTQALDREEKAVYTLTVTARDKGGLQVPENAVVEITINDIQDTQPEFNSDGYSFSVREDDGLGRPNIGRSVGQVHASSRDVLGSIIYAITGGDPGGFFTVNPSSGVLTTAKAIDREENAFYSLTIVASGGNIYGEAEVNISVTDLNDNGPKFAHQKVEAYVVENWPVGHNVYLAAAYDPDAGSNADVTYTLLPGSSPLFKIHESSGMVYLGQSLIQVEETKFTVKVKATDGGPNPRSSEMEVTILLRDVNDHTPTFQQSSYEVSVIESRPVNDRFFRIIAEDKDNGLNGEVTYKISKGNTGNRFGVFPDGVVYIARDLDRETEDTFGLVIVAQDRGVEPRYSHVNLTIHVLDANDNEPKFTNDTYLMSVLENSPIDTYVGSVKARDKDFGRNAEVSYRIDGVAQGFMIHPKSGSITTTKSFDREELLKITKQESFSIAVIASDNGEIRKHASTIVNIKIADANDNAPKFSQEIFTPSLFENAEIDTQVVRISATDADVGINSKITYSITGGNEDNKFTIGSQTGQVVLAGRLDREVTPHYILTVMAKDGGIPALNTTVDIRITVLDNNDKAPQFLQQQTQFEILETTETGTFITKVTAHDEDFGNNALVTYSITDGNIGTMFHIDSNTGRLYLAAPLDYELRQQYELNVTATDLGSPRLSSTITVVINVLDFNDNAPAFSASAIVRQIEEHTDVGTSILMIRANDPDSGVNGEIHYSISNQDPPGNHFAVNAQTGLITTSADIDREFTSSFKLTIVATDQALPESTRKSAEKLVTVIVLDLNDNAPKFVSMNAVALLLGTQPNALVSRVLAIDHDDGANSEVEYELASGNSNMFFIDSGKGNLYLRSSLSGQAFTTSLSIRARDKGMGDRYGQQSSIFQLTVFAKADSENGPAFSQTSYSGNVYENEPAGTSVVTVSASYSPGSVANLEYYITGITSSGISRYRNFQVHLTSGVISTTEILDREDGVEQYDLEVYVVDKSSVTPKTRRTQVHIKILDQNDSPPVFNPSIGIPLQVVESALPGHILTNVIATDADEEGSVQYSIADGAQGMFAIEPNSGELTVLKPLDREQKSKYILRVVANDGQQSSEALVNVEVTDINDEAPQFSQTSYSFDIPEDARTGTTVGRVSAIDRDMGRNSDVSYMIVSHWGRDKFSLHPHTGVVTLIDTLDYEQIHHYVLTIKAQDDGTIPLSSSVTVYMNVMDVNDNAPVFDPSSYSDEVWENATAGTSILGVTATDIDSGDNGRLTYAIGGGNPSGLFSIDSNSGIIYTAKQLDRETQAHYSLVLIASDHAEQPERKLSTSAMVSVILKDINDNAPEFTSPGRVIVMENLVRGTPVFTVTATDKDAGRNGYVQYSLAGPRQNLFSIDAVEGIVKVRQSLDREVVSSLSLQIVATDKGVPPKSSTMSLEINVGDDNDNSPIFQQKLYEATISEDDDVGTSLLRVLASDKDISLNGDIRYLVMSGDDNQDFYLDSHVGEFFIDKRLDYERKDQYEITIIAQDLGEPPKSDTASIRVTVTDVNDSPPVFVNSPFVAYVQENVEDLPVHVMHISARDDDSEPYAKVSYAITDGDTSLFKVDSTSGEIKAYRTLDRETKSSYEVTVMATDSGSPRLTGSGTVTILVQDVNDNPPIFRHGYYAARVVENDAPPTRIVQVAATDADDEENAQIRYDLLEESDYFTVDGETGWIFTKAMLNREDDDKYHLVVKATDGGMIPKSSTVSVTVSVEDLNDNEPQFTQRSYTTYVRDPTNTGQFVLGVTAVDADLGKNGQIVYSIIGRGDSASFAIDPTTGIITAKRTLEASSGGYRLYIRATDKGQNPLSDEVTVEVRLLPFSTTGFPTFTSSSRSFRLPEDTEIGHVLTSVSATMPNPAIPVTYVIAGGNVDQSFAVEMDGQVKIARSLDFESASHYSLWVKAQDKNNPSLFAHLGLEIDVTDRNDNPPVFDQLYYNASVPEEEFNPLTVAIVLAVDADSGDNGRVTYHLTAGNDDGMFAIDAVSGRITTVSKLNREAVNHYNLEIEAVDHGTPANTATAVVDVYVMDRNDRPPAFTQHFNTRISESASVGSFVLKITSTDADIGSNSAHVYSLISNPGNKFAIDEKTGVITVRGELDFESKEVYVLRVATNDGAYNPETSVTIDIMDANDNAPQFMQQEYILNFVEHQEVGSLVGRVTAYDRDADGQNSEIFYRFQTPTKYFKINSETGEIFSRKQLVYMKAGNGPSPENIHHLVVLATDQGEPPLSWEVPVTVEVRPSNKNAPKFDKNTYIAYVPENAVLGYTVIQISASDDVDTGPEAEVEYHKTGGNGTRLFDLDLDSGVLTLVTSVDGHRGRHYAVEVEAQDKGTPPRQGAALVKVEVVEVNRHAPRFIASNHLSFTTTIPENKEIGTHIAKVSAVDDDPMPGGQVSYYITGGDPNMLFSVDESQGYLKLAKNLDYETSTSFSLSITARDRAPIPRETTRVFTVNVTDVNDNPPLFDQPSYDAYIDENSASGTFVINANATDKDEDPVIEYYITGTREALDKFSVDKDTGVILSQGSIDYEAVREYQIVLKAINSGTSFSGTTTINVHVKGVNEFIPIFEKEEYNYITSESASSGAILGVVKATDDDEGRDGDIFYYFIGDSNQRGLSIDHVTGVVTVSGSVDRESSSEILLTVLAKNHGPIRGNDTSTCLVRIGVRDANDPPTFTQKLYEHSVRENATLGTSVIQVTATDDDLQDEYRQFTYSMARSSQLFRINPSNGWITLHDKLDRETIGVYNFSVTAVDSGNPPRTGTTMVRIRVSDVNDNAPYFRPAIPVGNATENQPPYSEDVLNLVPFTTDDDIPPNQGAYKYHLLDNRHLFDISLSGILKVKVELDKESVPEYEMTVRVTDNGIPAMSSTLTVRVLVADVNDSPPITRPLKIVVYVFKNIFLGGKIADVKPIDQDQVGDYSCQIVGPTSGLFSIPSACNLHTSQAQIGQTYQVNISATDGANGNVFSTTTVSFKEFSQEMVDSSAVVQLSGVSVTQFLVRYYQSFLDAVSDTFSPQEAVILYAMSNRDGQAELFMVVQESNGQYKGRSSLALTLQTNQDSIQSKTGIRMSAINPNLCRENLCENGGECISDIVVSEEASVTDSPLLVFTSHKVQHVAKCRCQEGYSGDQCEVPPNPCAINPCLNGGVCLGNKGSEVNCQCNQFWRGRLCEDDINECREQQPCRNGGTCENSEGGYTCRCMDEFMGDNCEIGTDPCLSEPCKNDGECRSRDLGYQCNCQFGERGSHCEVRGQTFQELSFQEYRLPLDQTRNTIFIEFATVQENALLLYNPGSSGNEFIAVEILNGQVKFSFALGEGSPTEIEIQRKVSNGQWWRIEAERDGKVGKLRVSSCPDGASECDICMENDASCFARQDSDMYQVLSLSDTALSVGGVRDFQTILDNQGQVSTHDFVGCLRSLEVDRVDLFQTQASESHDVLPVCTRPVQGRCAVNPCNNGGLCVDEWTWYRCECQPGFTGAHCEKDAEPVPFDKTIVVYQQQESYKRDQQLAAHKQRSRRNVMPSGGHSVSLRFRTQEEQGLLFASHSGKDFTIIQVWDGSVEYHSQSFSKLHTIRLPGSVKDGAWHNVTLIVMGSTASLQLDGISKQETFRVTLHDPLDLYMTSMSIGGSTTPVVVVAGNKPVQEFTGCMSEFRINGEVMPFDGATYRFKAKAEGGSSSVGCDALFAVMEPQGSGMHYSIYIVIAFFLIILLVIAVVFGFLYWRRKQKKAAPVIVMPCANGSISKSNGPMLDKANDSRIHQDSGYTESGDLSEEAIIRQHIQEELAARMFEEREVSTDRMSSRPDIIAPEGNSVHLEDGTVIVENGGIDNTGYNEEPPEHYDIDNASSIAPSDLVDVVAHYKHYRYGHMGLNKYSNGPGGPGYHKHHHKRSANSPITVAGDRPRGESPLNIPRGRSPANFLNHRDSPNIHAMQSTPLSRQSPHSLASRQSPLTVNSASSPLTINNVNNLSRQSPISPLARATSPLNQLSGPPRPSSAIPLGMRDKRASPLHHQGPNSLRSTPINGLYSSNASNSSYDGRPNLPPSHVPSRPGSRLKQPLNQLGMRSTPTMGLSIEDVERLNARRKLSPVSTLDAVSSSSDDRVMNNRPELRHPHMRSPVGVPLEPPESSSEDSSNDSFTCSEFEYDNDKIRNDLDARRLRPRFNKLPEVDNENDDTDVSRTFTGSESAREGSLSTFFASEDEMPGKGNKLLNGALNWDYLLNWGPNFEKLVGVFNDIAELPDADTVPKKSRLTSSPIGEVEDSFSPDQSNGFTSEPNIREEYV